MFLFKTVSFKHIVNIAWGDMEMSLEMGEIMANGILWSVSLVLYHKLTTNTTQSLISRRLKLQVQQMQFAA